jgi:hypothetical protein
VRCPKRVPEKLASDLRLFKLTKPVNLQEFAGGTVRVPLLPTMIIWERPVQSPSRLTKSPA